MQNSGKKKGRERGEVRTGEDGRNGLRFDVAAGGVRRQKAARRWEGVRGITGRRRCTRGKELQRWDLFFQNREI